MGPFELLLSQSDRRQSHNNRQQQAQRRAKNRQETHGAKLSGKEEYLHAPYRCVKAGFIRINP
jgi:hypothetical protein